MSYKNKLRRDAQPLKLLESTNRFLPLDNQKRPISAWKMETNLPNGFDIDSCLEFPETQAIGVLLGKNLICIDFDGETAINYACEIGIDITGQTWQVKRDSYKVSGDINFFIDLHQLKENRSHLALKKLNITLKINLMMRREKHLKYLQIIHATQL